MVKLDQDFLQAQKFFLKHFDSSCSNIVQEPESKEYGACQFTIQNKKAAFRIAKITPTKVGQFVTFWKRSQAGPIAPFDESDSIDLFIVSVRDGDKFGQFIFPKSVLIEHDIMSKNHIGGKRAIRVYPSWDKTDNKQAIRTQSWQLKYFYEISNNS
ncbi:MAG: MepB family protein [Candidatus Dependentiae bacterium]|nr:MepB family protein [Candidatus Dependentiae bacterium]